VLHEKTKGKRMTCRATDAALFFIIGYNAAHQRHTTPHATERKREKKDEEKKKNRQKKRKFAFFSLSFFLVLARASLSRRVAWAVLGDSRDVSAG
jgi:hypothetical protein